MGKTGKFSARIRQDAGAAFARIIKDRRASRGGHPIPTHCRNQFVGSQRKLSLYSCKHDEIPLL